MTLKDLKIGETGRVGVVGGEGDLRRHFLDMGLIPGAEITLVKFAPLGDPMEFEIHGYELTLRKDDAAQVEVTDVHIRTEEEKEQRKKKYSPEVQNKFLEHPGLGEGGKFHDSKTEKALPEGSTLSFALAGNQNCGKTTLFNQLTGSNQHVGNFPGVTVDRKSGSIRGYENTSITDLPGIYSLSPYTAEEIVSRKFILEEHPSGIINIVDATNIERNLYLTLQLMELEVPMVLAVNMMDELTGNGGAININAMEELLGIPVVPVAAVKDQGVEELVKHALHIAKYQEKPGRTDFCKADEDGGSVHRCIHGIIHLIIDHAEEAGIPARFAATKLVEGDPFIEEALKLSQNEKEMIEHIIIQMEEERGLDRVAAIADMRYDFIKELCSVAVTKPRESKEKVRSEKLDKLLTGKYTALPSFIVIMGLMFWLSFGSVGKFLQGLLEKGINAVTIAIDTGLTNLNVDASLHSLIVDGAIKGVGSVLSFLPLIIILFLCLSLLEDTGYMARVAFFTDKLLRKIGLSGRSIVPMVIGFGCSVPAIMSTRTLPSERDRRLTVMLTPFMSCTAKLPVYGFLTAAFFPEHAALIIIGLYIFGIINAAIVASIAKKTIYKGEAVPFVMELPNYRMPALKNVAMLLWDKTKDFLQKAFTIIFVASVAIWFLSSFDFRLNFIAEAGDASSSMLAAIAGFIAPIFKPLGFGEWTYVTALVVGFVAKESVVSTLNVLLGTAAMGLSIPAAAALLVFCHLYTPCVAAIAAVKRELDTKSAIGVVAFQCILAWIMAFIVKLLLTIIL